jgi:hypothetical protein
MVSEWRIPPDTATDLLDEWEAEAARLGQERTDRDYWSEGEVCRDDGGSPRLSLDVPYLAGVDLRRLPGRERRDHLEFLARAFVAPVELSRSWSRAKH